MALDIHVTVAAVVERDGRFLCVEETVGGQLVINQPAGHLEPHESLLQAAIREAREETAWDFVPEALLGVYHYASLEGVSYLRFAFVGQAIRHHPEQPLDRGITRALWLSRSELAACASRHRGPQVMQAIKDYDRGQRFPLEVVGNPT